jgi:hypothetical protein
MGEDDLEAMAAQAAGQEIPQFLVVLDQQNLRHGAPSFLMRGYNARRGRRLPLENRLS